MDDVPHEILEDILLSTLPSFSDIRQNMDRRYTPLEILVPLSISHVCRRWRTTALALPDLWTHIYVDLDAPCMSKKVLKEWTSRSESQPLTIICISGASQSNAFSSRPTCTTDLWFLHHILSLMPRWGDVFLNANVDFRCRGSRRGEPTSTRREDGKDAIRWDKHGQLNISPSFEYSTPLLSKLVLGRHGTLQEDPSITFTLLSKSPFPRLNELEIMRDRTLRWRPALETFTFGPKLEVVRQLKCRLALAHRILASPAVRNVELQVEDEADPDDESNRPGKSQTHPSIRVAPCLHTLHLACSVMTMQTILNQFSAPALTTLELTIASHQYFPDYKTFGDEQIVGQFLQRSGGRCQSHIEKLLLIAPGFDDHECACPLPIYGWGGLVDLTLHGVRMGDVLEIMENCAASIRRVSLAFTQSQSQSRHTIRNSPRIHCDKLHSLSISTSSSAGHIEIVLEHLIAPSLSVLQVSFHRHYLDEEVATPHMVAFRRPEHFLRFLARSNCRLSAFHLALRDRATVCSEGLITFLSHPCVNDTLKTLVLEADDKSATTSYAILAYLAGTSSSPRPGEDSTRRPEKKKKDEWPLPLLRNIILVLPGDSNLLKLGQGRLRLGALSATLRHRFVNVGLRRARIQFHDDRVYGAHHQRGGPSSEEQELRYRRDMEEMDALRREVGEFDVQVYYHGLELGMGSPGKSRKDLVFQGRDMWFAELGRILDSFMATSTGSMNKYFIA